MNAIGNSTLAIEKELTRPILSGNSVKNSEYGNKSTLSLASIVIYLIRCEFIDSMHIILTKPISTTITK
jgi:hypothetical protein